MAARDDSQNDHLLCCLLWAREGRLQDLHDYEDAVLAFLPDHGAEVSVRVFGDGAETDPDEVQLLRFPDPRAVEAFVADPRRGALSGERERAVARTVTFPVTVPAARGAGVAGS